MPDRFPLHTEYYSDRSNALAYYAGLRCLGVPKAYAQVSEEGDRFALIVYGDSPDAHVPPGFPRHDEHMQAKLGSYNDSVAKLGVALRQIAPDWQMQHTIRFSQREEDFVFAVDMIPNKQDRDFRKKQSAVQMLFQKIQRETGEEYTMSERTFTMEDPLTEYGSSGISFEMPLSRNFLKVAHCNTLSAYDTPPSTGPVRK
jgi:hypothetical protein